MLDELKNISNIGRCEDVVYFLQVVIGDRRPAEKDIRTTCLHEPHDHLLKVDALLAYCTCLDLISRDDGHIQLNGQLLESVNDTESLIDFLVERTLSVLFGNKVFREDFFAFDTSAKRYIFKNHELPLCWATIRNLLIDLGFISMERTIERTEFLISQRYEEMLSRYCIRKKREMSINELREQLERNAEAGEKAEQFVLDYEKKRVDDSFLKEQIRIISDIDVCAGYDIISFDSARSKDYDRFIEVKAVPADLRFYWSRNELEEAQKKGPKYHLYLVELSKIEDGGYQPIIIRDPATTLFELEESEDWIIEPQIYMIKHFYIQ